MLKNYGNVSFTYFADHVLKKVTSSILNINLNQTKMFGYVCVLCRKVLGERALQGERQCVRPAECGLDRHWKPMVSRCGFCSVRYTVIARMEHFARDQGGCLARSPGRGTAVSKDSLLMLTLALLIFLFGRLVGCLAGRWNG